jgi:hypothetical protein
MSSIVVLFLGGLCIHYLHLANFGEDHTPGTGREGLIRGFSPMDAQPGTESLACILFSRLEIVKLAGNDNILSVIVN